MICCSFVFKPGQYDDDFHRLDDQIDQVDQPRPDGRSDGVRRLVALGVVR